MALAIHSTLRIDALETFIESEALARFCCEFLNLQRLAELAFPNQPLQMRHKMRYVIGLRLPVISNGTILHPSTPVQVECQAQSHTREYYEHPIHKSPDPSN